MNPDSAAPKPRSSQARGPLASPRILVLRAGAIGDTLMTTPLVRALRRTFPNAYLVYVCSRSAYDVLRYSPHLDRVIPLAYRHLPAWLSREKWDIARELREPNLDFALVLESHPSFIDLVRRTRPRRLIAFGPVPDASGFGRAIFDPKRHSIDNYLGAAIPLGVQSAGREMELSFPARLDEVVWQRLAGRGLRETDYLVGIHPGWGGRKQASDQTRLRSWPPQRFAEVMQWLAKRGQVRVLLTGSKADRPLTEYLVGLSGVPCLNLAGEFSLLELAALIRRLNLYLTVDTGPAHLAAALGTPLVTLWGPGIFEQTSPQGGSGLVRTLYHRVHCAPCYGTALMKTCVDNICMKQIEAGEVIEALAEMWSLVARREGEPPPVQAGLRSQA